MDDTRGFDFGVVDEQYNYVVEKIDIHCPVRLYHAYTDEVVKWQTPLSLLENLPESCDARLLYARSGTHKLSRDIDYRNILKFVKELREMAG